MKEKMKLVKKFEKIRKSHEKKIIRYCRKTNYIPNKEERAILTRIGLCV